MRELHCPAVQSAVWYAEPSMFVHAGGGKETLAKPGALPVAQNCFHAALSLYFMPVSMRDTSTLRSDQPLLKDIAEAVDEADAVGVAVAEAVADDVATHAVRPTPLDPGHGEHVDCPARLHVP